MPSHHQGMGEGGAERLTTAVGAIFCSLCSPVGCQLDSCDLEQASRTHWPLVMLEIWPLPKAAGKDWQFTQDPQPRILAEGWHLYPSHHGWSETLKSQLQEEEEVVVVPPSLVYWSQMVKVPGQDVGYPVSMPGEFQIPIFYLPGEYLWILNTWLQAVLPSCAEKNPRAIEPGRQHRRRYYFLV